MCVNCLYIFAQIEYVILDQLGFPFLLPHSLSFVKRAEGEITTDVKPGKYTMILIQSLNVLEYFIKNAGIFS